GEEFGEGVGLLGDEVEEPHHHAGAALWVGGGPTRLGGLGVLHRLAQLVLGSKRDPGDDLARHRLEDVRRAARPARNLLAADEMSNLAHGVSLLWVWSCPPLLPL